MRYSTVVLALALCAASAMATNNAEPLRAVSASTELFSTDLFKTISKGAKGKNLISSPLSAHVVISMTAYGAGGKTAQQMRQALRLPKDDAVARQGFQNLMDQLNNVENVTLEIANKMYVAEDLKLKSEYKQLTSDNFRSEASQLDLTKSAESVKIVNSWVDEKTHHKISEILAADDITTDTRMILLNAVYFKGKWHTQFKKEGTQDRIFHLDEKTEKKVPTMFVSGSFIYGELPDLKAKFIELPYENKDLKMVIIVPDEVNGLSHIVENLESFNQTRIAQSGIESEVQLFLPKFKIESTIDLEKPLEELGMTDMFTNGANFTGIANEPLKVSKVLQKAFIEVNEEGSEAAAVTALRVVSYSAIPWPRPKLRADRPFAFRIIDARTRVELFTGHVVQPKSG